MAGITSDLAKRSKIDKTRNFRDNEFTYVVRRPRTMPNMINKMASNTRYRVHIIFVNRQKVLTYYDLTRFLLESFQFLTHYDLTRFLMESFWFWRTMIWQDFSRKVFNFWRTVIWQNFSWFCRWHRGNLSNKYLYYFNFLRWRISFTEKN